MFRKLLCRPFATARVAAAFLAVQIFLTSARFVMELANFNAAKASSAENTKIRAEINKADEDLDNAKIFAKFLKKAEEVAQAAV
jgi:hypothetical protein